MIQTQWSSYSEKEEFFYWLLILNLMIILVLVRWKYQCKHGQNDREYKSK